MFQIFSLNLRMEKIIHISAGTEYSCSTPIANSGEDGYMQYSFSKSELAIYADVFFDISFDAAIILNEYISKFSKDCDVDDWVKVGDSASNFNFQESSSETMCCLLGALCPSHINLYQRNYQSLQEPSMIIDNGITKSLNFLMWVRM